MLKLLNEMDTIGSLGEAAYIPLEGDNLQYLLKSAELQEYHTIVTDLFQKLAAEQPYTAVHALGVNRLSFKIAQQMACFTDLSLLYLHWGTLLHDIGKLAISADILLKPADLTLAEYELVSEHSAAGAGMMKRLPKEVRDIVHYHHERYDGEGYPVGLRGECIPILARVCAVADALEAMTSDKPYRKALAPQQAADELFWNCGTQFDPLVVDAFFKWDISNSKIAI